MLTNGREEDTGTAIRGSAMRELGSVSVMARLLPGGTGSQLTRQATLRFLAEHGAAP